MRIESVGESYAICGDSTAQIVLDAVDALMGEQQFALIVADPPYGKILNADWDKTDVTDSEFAGWMIDWTRSWSDFLMQDAAFYVWGGVGKPGFRPFFKYLAQVENEAFQLANLITWSKKRAYGVKHNYLFTREECAYFINGYDIKKPRCFNIPLLETKRGYAGYNKKYPAKSEFYRRTNVWTDVTEVMQGKVHEAQKAQRVIEIPIEVHTQVGEWVLDPFAGSGTTAFAAMKLGRKFVVIEKDEKTFEDMLVCLQAHVVEQRQHMIVLSHGREASG